MYSVGKALGAFAPGWDTGSLQAARVGGKTQHCWHAAGSQSDQTVPTSVERRLQYDCHLLELR